MSEQNDRPSAPNFTTACIVMFGVNLIWIMTLIWAVWGMLAAAATGWAVKLVIDQIEARRA